MARQLIELPLEVLDHIIGFSSTADWISLSQTCRTAYTSTLPFLWRNVQIGHIPVVSRDHPVNSAVTPIKRIEISYVNEQAVINWPHMRQLTKEKTYNSGDQVDQFLKALQNGDISRRALESIHSMTICCGYMFNEFSLQHFGIGSVGTAMSVGTMNKYTLNYLEKVLLNPLMLPNLNTIGIFTPSEKTRNTFYMPNSLTVTTLALEYFQRVLDIVKNFDSESISLHLSGLTITELSRMRIPPSWKIVYLELSEGGGDYASFLNILPSLFALRVLKIEGPTNSVLDTFNQTELSESSALRDNLLLALSQLNSLIGVDSVLLGVHFYPKLVDRLAINCMSLTYDFATPAAGNNNTIFSWHEFTACKFTYLRMLSLNISQPDAADPITSVLFRNLEEVHVISRTNIPVGLNQAIFTANRGLKRVVTTFLTQDDLEALARCSLITTLCIISDEENKASTLPSNNADPYSYEHLARLTTSYAGTGASCWPNLQHLFIQTLPLSLNEPLIDSVVRGSPAMIQFAIGYRITRFFNKKRHYPALLRTHKTSATNGVLENCERPLAILGAVKNPLINPENSSGNMNSRMKPMIEYWLPAIPSVRRPFSDDHRAPPTTSRPIMEYYIGTISLKDWISPSKIIRLDVQEYRASLRKDPTK